MSHLSTVLRDEELLKASLCDLGTTPLDRTVVEGFEGQATQVRVAAELEDGLRISWRCDESGHLEVVADLQRLSIYGGLERISPSRPAATRSGKP